MPAHASEGDDTVEAVKDGSRCLHAVASFPGSSWNVAALSKFQFGFAAGLTAYGFLLSCCAAGRVYSGSPSLP